MKKIRFLSAYVLFLLAGMIYNPLLGQDPQVDTLQTEKARVDTVYVERVTVDTVYVEKANAEPQQEQIKEEEQKPQGSKGRNEKVYYGGYANFSVGKYTRIGFEPLIAYKIFPKFSVGGKLSYEFVKDKRYDTDYESSNYGFSLFARRRFFRKLYAHIEYSEMNYKIYDELGSHDRYWVSFLYLGGGVSLPISKSASLNAEVLWDLIQDKHSPYKSLQPFVNIGIGIGF